MRNRDVVAIAQGEVKEEVSEGDKPAMRWVQKCPQYNYKENMLSWHNDSIQCVEYCYVIVLCFSFHIVLRFKTPFLTTKFQKLPKELKKKGLTNPRHIIIHDSQHYNNKTSRNNPIISRQSFSSERETHIYAASLCCHGNRDRTFDWILTD